MLLLPWPPPQSPRNQLLYIGPVPLPFNNNAAAGDASADDLRLVKEYGNIVPSLPTNPKLTWLRCYRSVWVYDSWVPGRDLSPYVRRGAFVPRPSAARRGSRPSRSPPWRGASTHRRSPSIRYPGSTRTIVSRSWRSLSLTGWGKKMEALPSPRLMATHMHHSLLPASISADNDLDSKIVYICR
uniref:Sulfotransferase n=1 Tax=Leersia perrieri TaxID=77586 RepID=A0A0D9WVG6_9ORYZ